MKTVLIVAAMLLLINAWVTARIFRSDLYSSKQRQLQYLLVWLVPIVGAVVTWAALRAQSFSLNNNNVDVEGSLHLHWNYPDANEVDPLNHRHDQEGGNPP